jgi:hypothetical protein
VKKLVIGTALAGGAALAVHHCRSMMRDHWSTSSWQRGPAIESGADQHGARGHSSDARSASGSSTERSTRCLSSK